MFQALRIDFLIALRNLLQHTKRNLFLGTAVAAVTALLVVLGAFTAGIRGAMLESATTLMTGHVNVGGFFKFTSGSSAPLVSDYPKVLEEVRQPGARAGARDCARCAAGPRPSPSAPPWISCWPASTWRPSPASAGTCRCARAAWRRSPAPGPCSSSRIRRSGSR